MIECFKEFTKKAITHILTSSQAILWCRKSEESKNMLVNEAMVSGGTLYSAPYLTTNL